MAKYHDYYLVFAEFLVWGTEITADGPKIIETKALIFARNVQTERYEWCDYKNPDLVPITAALFEHLVQMTV